MNVDQFPDERPKNEEQKIRMVVIDARNDDD